MLTVEAERRRTAGREMDPPSTRRIARCLKLVRDRYRDQGPMRRPGEVLKRSDEPENGVPGGVERAYNAYTSWVWRCREVLAVDRRLRQQLGQRRIQCCHQHSFCGESTLGLLLKALGVLEERVALQPLPYLAGLSVPINTGFGKPSSRRRRIVNTSPPPSRALGRNQMAPLATSEVHAGLGLVRRFKHTPPRFNMAGLLIRARAVPLAQHPHDWHLHTQTKWRVRQTSVVGSSMAPIN
jgi:hypothetical protein